MKCRVCAKEVNRQGYEAHLKAQHPTEVSTNLRTYGQSVLAWGGVKRKKPSGEVEATVEEDAVVEDDGLEDVVEDAGLEDVVVVDAVEGVDMAEDAVVEKDEPDSLAAKPMDLDIKEEPQEELDEAEVEEKDQKEHINEKDMVDIEQVNDVLHQMLTKIDVNVDLNFCQNETEKMNKYLAIVEKRLEIKKDVNSLMNSLKDLKMTESEIKCGPEPEVKDADMVIKVARSLKEITEMVPVFVYQDEQQKVSCDICNQDFSYKEEESDFTEGMMSKRFSDLKRALRRHLTAEKHIRLKQETRRATEKEEKDIARNKKIGRTIGGLVYHLLSKARPDSDLPLLIYTVKRAGGDVGDINHSHLLVAKLLPDIAGAVAGRLKNFLSSPMVATGSLPPVNIMADKATDKR